MLSFILIISSIIACNSKISYIHTSAGAPQLSCLNQAGYLDETFIWMKYSYTNDVIRNSADPSSIIQITNAKPFIVLRLE